MLKSSLFLFLLVLIQQQAYSQSQLVVGIASKDITPSQEEQIPLGGYGGAKRRVFPFSLLTRKPYIRGFRVSQGALDPIRSKVMYLNKGQKKLLLVSLDLIGVTKDMHKDLVEKLKDDGFSSSELIISGTHTHSGPGALSPNALWQAVAMDRFQRPFYNKFLNQVVDTVREAITHSEVAELHTLSFDTVNLQNNRRGGDRPLYPRANLLLAKSTSGAWMGGMVNFAVHGTWLDEDNLKFSSDVPGAIERSLSELLQEQNGYVRTLSNSDFIFINGAEGDVSPQLEYQELGVEFAKQTKENWGNIKPLLTDGWTVKQQEIDLGSPRINLSKCVEKNWIPKKLNIGVKKFISPKTLISQVRFGDIWFLTWPGEPTTELGLMLMSAAKEAGAQEAWVLGLTNDHLSYFVSEKEFEKGGYEACSNFFGATGGNKVIEAHKNLIKVMKGI